MHTVYRPINALPDVSHGGRGVEKPNFLALTKRNPDGAIWLWGENLETKNKSFRFVLFRFDCFSTALENGGGVFDPVSNAFVDARLQAVYMMECVCIVCQTHCFGDASVYNM